jgi:hypothetical protein
MKKAIIPAVVLALFAGLGCDLFSIPANGGDGDGEGEWQEPLSPRAVIEDIQYCYNTADYTDYTILLDEDNFVFYFDPKDVQEHGLPISWLYQAEIEATDHLFTAVTAANISLTLTFNGDDSDYEPNPMDTSFTMNNIEYDLTVYDEDADPEPTIYKATGHGDFILSKFEDNAGLMRWWLTIWHDFGSA